MGAVTRVYAVAMTKRYTARAIRGAFRGRALYSTKMRDGKEKEGRTSGKETRSGKMVIGKK